MLTLDCLYPQAIGGSACAAFAAAERRRLLINSEDGHDKRHCLLRWVLPPCLERIWRRRPNSVRCRPTRRRQPSHGPDVMSDLSLAASSVAVPAVRVAGSPPPSAAWSAATIILDMPSSAPKARSCGRTCQGTATRPAAASFRP